MLPRPRPLFVPWIARSFACIQGPPAAGKRVVGGSLVKCLVANQGSAAFGPIICVGFTNNTLNQLLENLLDDGVQGIVRLGQRSRGGQRLMDISLCHVAEKFPHTTFETSVK